MHSDAQLSERVRYKMRPGTLTVGSGATCDIQLGGIYVLEHHCTLHCEQEPAAAAGAAASGAGAGGELGADWSLGGWYVSVEPMAGASVYVNGQEVGGTARVRPVLKVAIAPGRFVMLSALSVRLCACASAYLCLFSSRPARARC